MFTVKTQCKFIRAKIKVFFTRNREVKWSIRGVCWVLLATATIGLIAGKELSRWAYPGAFTTRFLVTRSESVEPSRVVEEVKADTVEDSRTKESSVEQGGDIQDLGQSPDPCTMKDVVCDGEIEEIVAKVYRLESSGGKNDSCLEEGKYNGYGYAQSKFSWNCYDTKEEVRTLVVEWFKKHLQDKTIAEATCYYNTGIIQSECKYYKNYLSL